MNARQRVNTTDKAKSLMKRNDNGNCMTKEIELQTKNHRPKQTTKQTAHAQERQKIYQQEEKQSLDPFNRSIQCPLQC